jgi:hypothetical protein
VTGQTGSVSGCTDPGPNPMFAGDSVYIAITDT